MLSEKCYKAWEERVSRSLLSRVCFMSEEEMKDVVQKCIDLILRKFPDLPPRYKQNYKMTLNSAREPMLSVILFTMHLLPEESPIKPSPSVHKRLRSTLILRWLACTRPFKSSRTPSPSQASQVRSASFLFRGGLRHQSESESDEQEGLIRSTTSS